MNDGGTGTAKASSKIAAKADCQNCGEQLRGDYCHACGASSREGRDRTVGSFLRDAIGQITDLEGSKLLRTLWLLLSRPGMLSKEHFSARRVRYLKPINLFLMVFAANIVAYAAGTGVSLYEIRPVVQQSASAKAQGASPNPLIVKL